MPWMGRHRGLPHHPVRLINLLVAGMLVFFGAPALASSSPALKPQRLERSCISGENRRLSSVEQSLDQPGVILCRYVGALPVHEFVDAFLSAPGVVTAYIKTQIGFDPARSILSPVQPVRVASPRGPPVKDLS